jgi:hypothetical protein
MDTMGGSELIVPVHATVMILGFPRLSILVTITTGTGLSIVEGFHWILGIKRIL